MPATHKLKTDPTAFLDILHGVKRCVVYWDIDRRFKVRDRLHLIEFNRDTNSFSGKDCVVDVLHIQSGDDLPDGLVVMSISDMLSPAQLT